MRWSDRRVLRWKPCQHAPLSEVGTEFEARGGADSASRRVREDRQALGDGDGGFGEGLASLAGGAP
jgi:hypothetical protein